MCDGITPRDYDESGNEKKTEFYGTYTRSASDVKADAQAKEEAKKQAKKHWLPNWRNALRCD